MAAISTVIFDGPGFARGAEILADMGFGEVEPAYIEGYTPFDETTFTVREGRAVAALFASRGIVVSAISAHTDLGRPDGAERLLRRLDFAAGAGAATVVSNATHVSARSGLMRTLERALPRYAEAGVVLALENPGHGSGALLCDGRAGAALVAEWDSPWLRLNYDVGNAFTYARGRIDIAADLAAARPVAKRVHLKDVAEVGGDWHFCPLGGGIVGYGADFPWKELTGLDITIEHPIRLWRPGKGDPVRFADVPAEAAIRRALSQSAACLAAAGSGGAT